MLEAVRMHLTRARTRVASLVQTAYQRLRDHPAVRLAQLAGFLFVFFVIEHFVFDGLLKVEAPLSSVIARGYQYLLTFQVRSAQPRYTAIARISDPVLEQDRCKAR